MITVIVFIVVKPVKFKDNKDVIIPILIQWYSFKLNKIGTQENTHTRKVIIKHRT